MFGYIIPDKMNMYVKDFAMFRAYYCGLCKTLGKTGMPHTRFATNYDCTFISVLVHSLSRVDVTLERKSCVLSPLKKKEIVATDALSRKVADFTMLLFYYKADDDVFDGQPSRRLLRASISRRAHSAAKRLPKVDEIMRAEFEKLRALEKSGSARLDEYCEPFARLTALTMRELVEGDCFDDASYDFCYNIGRLIYLFDAVDDVWEDTQKHRFNPLTSVYGECISKDDFLKKNGEQLSFLLRSCYNKIVADYNQMKVAVGEGVLSNTVYLGLPMQIDHLLKGEEKCKMTRL